MGRSEAYAPVGLDEDDGVELGALDGCAPLGDCDDEPLKVDAQLIAQESAQERALSSHKEEARGMALIFASGIVFSVVSLMAKVAEKNGLHSLEVTWLSGVVRWIGLSTACVVNGSSPWPRYEVRLVLLARCLAGWVSLSCATYAFGALELGDATAIIFSSPAWAAILGFVFLRERLGLIELTAVALSIAGILCVSKPSFLFGDADSDADSLALAPTGSPVLFTLGRLEVTLRVFASCVAVLGSIASASVTLLVRVIGVRGGAPAATLAHANALFSVIVSPLSLLFVPSGDGCGPFQGLVGERRVLLFPTLCAVVGAGVLGVANQLLLNKGMQLAPAGLGSMMRNADIACAFLWQLLFFGVSPSSTSLLGAALIVLCSVGMAIRKYRAGMRNKPPT